MHRRRFAFVFATAALFGAPTVRAEPPTTLTRAQRESAEHTKRAFDAVKRADAETARLEFLQAYALAPSPKARWNLLVAEADSGHPLEALRHLRAYLADPRADPKKKDKATGLLAELAAQTGHLRIVAPAGVAVTVDGLAVTSEQRTEGLDVAPGKHAVEAVLEGETEHREVDAAAGEPTEVSFEAPPQETLIEAPTPIMPTPPREQKPVPPPVRERPSGISTPPVATWILGGTAVVALGTGIGFSLGAKYNRDKMDENPRACATPNSPECARSKALADAGEFDALVAWIAYGTAGAALVAGGLIWYFSPKAAPASRNATILPLISPGMSGVQLRTSF
ncbi:hypothetical protein LZC95_12155 [Pendulispora brunnea]|uniref:PEGA domain-containing protein n=1 Tax=Pendulispora brunnea TaxID=2905690 RepID=A0ABZ2KKT2_9BACT